MHFIGVFANNLEFELLSQNIMKILKRKDLNLINLNSKNMDYLKNITFETILLSNHINLNDNQKKLLSKICSKSKYIIINSDILHDINIVPNKMSNYITYGLNQKSTITISSIQEEKAIIYIQRNIKNIQEKEIEMGEISVNLEKNNKVTIENLLAIYSICLIYKYKLVEK